MRLVFINDLDWIKRHKPKSEFVYSSTEIEIIHQLRINNFKVFNIFEENVISKWNHIPIETIKLAQSLSNIFVSEQILDYDIRFCTLLIHRAEEISKRLIKCGIKELIVVGLQEKTILRSSGKPFNINANGIVLRRIIQILRNHNVNVKIAKKLLSFINLKHAKKHLSDFKNYINQTRILDKSSKTLIINDLMYGSEIKAVYTKNTKDVSEVNLSWLSKYLYFKIHLNISNHFVFTKKFKQISEDSNFSREVLDVLYNNLRAITTEVRKANAIHAFIKRNFIKLQNVYIGHDSFTLESHLCMTFHSEKINIYSFPHYGVGSKFSFDGITNNYSTKLIWNSESVNFIKSTDNKPLKFQFNSSKRFNKINNPRIENIKLSNKNKINLLILTAQPNLSLYDFNIDPIEYIKEFEELISRLENQFQIQIRNHPSFDNYSLFKYYESNYPSIKICNDHSIKTIIKDTPVCIMFNYNTTACLECIANGSIVISYYSNHQIHKIENSNIYESGIRFFDDIIDMVNFLSNLDVNLFYNILKEQTDFFNRFTQNH